jgi:hypothetical protein
MLRENESSFKSNPRSPTWEQIQRAAYERWERRGWTHGRHREDWLAAEKELTFLRNYQTIVEYPLSAPDVRVLGDRPGRQCRYCERASREVPFTAIRSITPEPIGNGSLMTAEVCDECQSDLRVPLEEELRRFWQELRSACTEEGPRLDGPGSNPFSVAALKSLIAGALLVLPETELRYFPDTLEWVNNPDHDCDISLFTRISCRVYSVPFWADRSWVSVWRRIDPEAAMPYLLYFLGSDGILVQVPVPLSLRDEDLDGLSLLVPERSLTAGHGAEFRESHFTLLPLSLAEERSRLEGWPALPLGRGQAACALA